MHIIIWILEGIAFFAFIAPALYFWIRVGTSNLVRLGPGMFILFGMAILTYFVLFLITGIAWLVNKDQSLLLWTAISNIGLLVLSIVLVRIIYLRTV